MIKYLIFTSMAAGGHFLFELIKIGILSAAYGTIVFFILRTIRWKNIKNVRQLWERCFWAVCLLLFVFMFTYWGDHGLGDDSYIPIHHYRTVNQSDETAYIENKRGQQIDVGKFTYNDRNLFAEIADKRQIDGDYLIWDLQKNEWKAYNAGDYITTTKSQPTASPANFKDFSYYYDNYWSGWRFWLLP